MDKDHPFFFLNITPPGGHLWCCFPIDHREQTNQKVSIQSVVGYTDKQFMFWEKNKIKKEVTVVLNIKSMMYWSQTLYDHIFLFD